MTAEGVEPLAGRVKDRSPDALVFTRADGQPWGQQDQKRPMALACRAAGSVPAVGFHRLRATYGSPLAQAGTPMSVIAKALGHADERMTQRHYAHLSPACLGEQVRSRLPTFSSIAAPDPQRAADPLPIVDQLDRRRRRPHR